MLTPHLGAHAREIRDERGRKVLANLKAHFAEEPVPYPFPLREA